MLGERAAVAPADPVAIGMSVTWKPVPKMIVSTSCSTPSAVTTPSGRISAMPSVTTSTLARRARVVVVGEQDALAADR